MRKGDAAPKFLAADVVQLVAGLEIEDTIRTADARRVR
jgi:hypothetical protein